ncbi:UNKNOWN [Stylonychia lemnae]|uniref:Uncharacterized protein n=1 Tax=Stylonychia lemnae TaxID=5949 RepID=A0A077ZVJ4_STYLE|nr:UNKNOWN [Stylonychia lemnae]|eukprot:CDW73644.1 UNKNOWN [Stylonychia lemnae]
MKSNIIAVLLLALLSISTLAQDYSRFSKAVFSYPKGRYHEISEELRTFLETELSNYKPIEVVEGDNLVQSKIEYIESTNGEVGETAFPKYFPVSMLKEMLYQNGMKLQGPAEDL